ncbi:MAG: hypothetical protein WAM14_02970 [Candidatus Nitrosopolaris sp.]
MSTTGGDNRTGTLTLQKEYPLPAQPSWQQPLPQLTLSDLKIGDLSIAHKTHSHIQLLQETRQRLFGWNVSVWVPSCLSMMSCGIFQVK